MIYVYTAYDIMSMFYFNVTLICRAVSFKSPNVHALFRKVHALFVKVLELFVKVDALFVKVNALFAKVHAQL